MNSPIDRRRNNRRFVVVIALIFCGWSFPIALGFAPPLATTRASRTNGAVLFSEKDTPEGEISRKLAQAKELLEKSKAKLAAKESKKDDKKTVPEAKSSTAEDDADTPFFAVKDDSLEKRSKVTKSKNSETGLITTDGDLMAKMSEEEAWEARPLSDVFENEIEEKSDATTIMERDIAASMRSMKTVMEMSDYKKIFDSRNRFIGEDS